MLSVTVSGEIELAREGKNKSVPIFQTIRDGPYFSQAVELFFFMLRFRYKDISFLDSENDIYHELFNRAKKCLEKSKRNFATTGAQASKAKRAQKLLEGIESYMYFKGTENLVELLDEFAENDEENGGAD